MTPFERLSAVRSEVTQTDMLLLSLLALVQSTSSAPPTTAKDKPTDRKRNSCGFTACVSLITKLTTKPPKPKKNLSLLMHPDDCFFCFFSQTNFALAAVLLMNCVFWQHWWRSVFVQ